MDYSRLAFQGYLEKTGLSIPEAEYAAKHARFAFTSYLQQVAEIYINSQGCAEYSRNSQGLAEVCRNSQEFAEICRN